VRLGIDTGGTYTDAVLVDGRDRIVAAAKRLTTAHDLTLGIGDVLAALPSGRFADIELVSLSTTLSTNSVVEGRGAPVAVLLPGYELRQVERSGLPGIVGAEQVVTLQGGHDALGRERQPLDEQEARQAIRRLNRKASAFAISSMFGVRNSAHEEQLRDWVREITDKPVTCGHELATRLDAPRRALTAALNARMVPVIRRLILAVEAMLRDVGIDAPLMMVKGNGSLISTRLALRQPVSTVLSGPAASVIGACALSGVNNAIVADMGGTTTDIAVVSEGRPELGEGGVLIGDWQPMIEAVRVASIGLGGDSEVRFNGASGIEIGPRRVVPISLLVHQYPQVLPALERQLETAPGRRDNRFALALAFNEEWMTDAGPEDHEAWARLAEGPLDIDALVVTERPIARAVARLQRRGMAIYSGFTPSDAAHVLGMCSHWSKQAAHLAALAWSRQMRHVYGLGRWADGDAEGPSRAVYERVCEKISQAVIEVGLHQERLLDQAQAQGLAGLLASLVYDSADRKASRSAVQQARPLFDLKFAAHYPVVAVGAPASTFFPQAAKRLGVRLRVPEHGEVANAYGAVMGVVIQHASLTVTQPLHGRFIVHSESDPREFSDLQEALQCARKLARERVHAMARRAGAGAVEISLAESGRHVQHEVDGELFLETVVTATASGRPDLDRLARTE
jgi:N-methylhydantoinase A/oxoprolinase/acetone carboxylase beta subunit